MSTMNGMVGKSVKRVEDKRFITGKGKYTDDIILPLQTYAYFVRSPYAHARIVNVDTGAAIDMPGVLAIYTGKDVEAINGVPCGWQVNFKNGDTMKEPKHPLLVADKVRHVGDAVAMVVAQTREQAKDAAQMAAAMNYAVKAGRLAYLSGRMPKRLYASASSPLEGAIK